MRPKEAAGGRGTMTLSSRGSFLPWFLPLTPDQEEPTSSKPQTWRSPLQVTHTLIL